MATASSPMVTVSAATRFGSTPDLDTGRVRLLLVEDDGALADTLCRALEREGFLVDVAGTIAAARALASESSPPARIVLVDLELPDGSGLNVLRDLSGRRDCGIIMLSGRASEVDRVVGLEMGADDFLTKPFSMREMAARVRALLRRLDEPEAAGATALEAADVLLDPNRQRLLCRDGREHRLTGAEAGLLSIMLSSPDHVANRDVVAQRVLGYALQPQQRGVDQFASSLRQKLQNASGGRIQVTAVRGRGYRLVW